MTHPYLVHRDAFAAGMDQRFYTIEYLDGLVMSGAAVVWGGDRAAIVAEIKEFPTGAKVIHGLIAAGDKRVIVNELIPQAEAWGREQGCDFAMIESRHGWARALNASGYAVSTSCIVKEL